MDATVHTNDSTTFRSPNLQFRAASLSSALAFSITRKTILSGTQKVSASVSTTNPKCSSRVEPDPHTPLVGCLVKPYFFSNCSGSRDARRQSRAVAARPRLGPTKKVVQVSPHPVIQVVPQMVGEPLDDPHEPVSAHAPPKWQGNKLEKPLRQATPGDLLAPETSPVCPCATGNDGTRP
jgi:hypothetical protein